MGNLRLNVLNRSIDSTNGELFRIIYDQTMIDTLSSWWIGDTIAGAEALTSKMLWDKFYEDNHYLDRGIENSNIITNNDIAKYLYSNKYRTCVTFDEIYNDNLQKVDKFVSNFKYPLTILESLLISPNKYTMPLDDFSLTDPYIQTINRVQFYFGVPRMYPEISDGYLLFPSFIAQFKSDYDRLDIEFKSATSVVWAKLLNKHPKGKRDGMNMALKYVLDVLNRQSTNLQTQKLQA